MFRGGKNSNQLIARQIGTISFYLLGVFMAVLAVRNAPMLIHHDVGAFIIIAERILDGEILYRDVSTTNTPFPVHFTVPPVWLAGKLGIQIVPCFVWYCFFLIQFTCATALSLFKRLDNQLSSLQLSILFCMLQFSFFLLSGREFGQREHIFAVLTVPYFIGCLLRLRGVGLSTSLSLLCGCLALGGFSFKPHFGLLFIVAEGFIMIRTRDWKSWARPDALLIAFGSVAYYAFVLIHYPLFLQQMIHNTTFYSTWYRPFSTVLFKAGLILALPLLAWVLARTKAPWSTAKHFWGCLLIGSLTIALVQRFGFYYHFLPSLVHATLLITSIIMGLRSKLIATLLLLVFIGSLELTHQRAFFLPQKDRPYANKLIAALNEHATDKDVVILDTSISPGWSLMAHSNCTYSRSWGMQVQILHGYADSETPEPVPHQLSEMKEHERAFHERVIKDLQDNPPEVFVLNTQKTHDHIPGKSISILACLLVDERFVAIWENYEKVDEAWAFEVYKRKQ
jgi:hypothetical protein